MSVEIKPYQSYSAGEIIPLYAAVGWTNYTASPEMLAEAYRNSLCVLGAYDGDKLVGIIRAVGDGASIVFVQDLLVLPDCQRRGIGACLMKTLMEQYAEVYQFELLTDDTPKTTAFYEALGFTPADRLGCRAYIKMKTPAE